jgi:hypothetical protein
MNSGEIRAELELYSAAIPVDFRLRQKRKQARQYPSAHHPEGNHLEQVWLIVHCFKGPQM